VAHETVSFQYCLVSITRNKFIPHQTRYIGCLKIQNYQHLFHKKLPKTNSNLCRLSFSVSCVTNRGGGPVSKREQLAVSSWQGIVFKLETVTNFGLRLGSCLHETKCWLCFSLFPFRVSRTGAVVAVGPVSKREQLVPLANGSS